MQGLLPDFRTVKGILMRPVVRIVLLASLSCMLLLADDFIQQLFTRANQAELELRYVVVLWLFSLGMCLCRWRLPVMLLLLLLSAMQLVQLAHISYMGESITPADLTSLFASFDEVRETGSHHALDHWPVLLAVGLPYGLLMFLHWRFRVETGVLTGALGLVLVLGILLAKPYRATYRDMDAFMPGPTRSALHNSLNAFAFFTVKLAGQPPLRMPASSAKPYTLTQVPSSAKHVWVVMADSLRSERLGVMGYGRNTTPNLSALHRQGVLLAKPGIAAGVSTAVSLPTFLNLLREPGQQALLRQQPYNLFRVARSQGFATYWMSAQESKLLSFIGSRHLDVSITREDHPAQFAQRHDHALVDMLQQQAFATKSFVVLNLRTAHSPYEKNYREHQQQLPAWPTDDSIPLAERKGNAYDLSIAYLDDVLGEIINRFDRLEGERYLLITGDHGQLLGEGGRWGHNDLVPEVASVPILVLARQAPAGALGALESKNWVSHYQAGVWLASRLGVRVDNPNERPGEHFLLGKLLLGENYIQVIEESGRQLKPQSPVLLSRWLAQQQPPR